MHAKKILQDYIPLLVFLLIISVIFPELVFAHGQEGVSQTVEIVENVVLLLHIITAVFMAWPLYALITVKERQKFSAPVGDKVDDFMEGIIKKNSKRCYVFQTTALLTGFYLVWSHLDLSFNPLVTNWILLGKMLGLFILMGLLSYVVFSLQPRIDSAFGKLKEISGKETVVNQINKLRLRRKKITGVCLFVLLTILLFAVQIREPFAIPINVILVALIGLFVYRVFKANIPYGWI